MEEINVDHVASETINQDNNQPNKRRKKGDQEKATKPPRLLILPNMQVKDCNRDDFLSFERRFKSVYSITQEDNVNYKEVYLTALVLDNNIALLVVPFPVIADEITFADAYSDLVILGKGKRGSKFVEAGVTIAFVKRNSQSIPLITPIAGKVIEMNEKLLTSPHLLNEDYQGSGFVMIVTTEAPKVVENNALLMSVKAPVNMDDRICFAWAKGKCSFGKDCKFLHCR
jgi:glycine cleavage system H lipoate-binding protein